jgi:phosphotransferase system enzyme I (PtsI)
MSLACTGIGIGSFHSIALGDAYVLHRGPVEVSPHWIDEEQVEEEIARFQRAIQTARHELQAVRDQIPEETPADIAEFIDAHLLMLEDVTITEAPLDLIRNQLCRAEWALQVRRDALVEVFDAMDDAYLRTRRDDVEHVVNQIQKILVDGRGPEPPVHEDMDGRVVIAQDLTPADIILMRHRGVSAFVTEFGGPMSHTAILARSLGIPAVVGVRNVTQYLKHGELLVVDGDQGVVLAEADDLILGHYCQLLEDSQAHRESLRQLLYQPSASADGESVHLMANIELAEDIDQARAAGATAIGLYRTEFLYMNRNVTPDEEEHLAAYLEVIRGLGGLPVTIRTLDLGADKHMDGRSLMNCPPVCNPALGLRAIRLCLKEPELFIPQVRAILRAATQGPVRMMLPMLSNVQEVLSARRMIEEAKQSLRRDGLDFDDNIRVGGMVEVPAAALSADAFAQHLDFLSLGTNDLIQYTLAIDRVDDEVNYLYDPLHPAVLQLIQMTIDAGQRRNIPVSMCGEMAGDPRYTRLLLGMGLRRFSMQPNSLLEVKYIVRRSNTAELRKRVSDLIARLYQEDGETLLTELNRP